MNKALLLLGVAALLSTSAATAQSYRVKTIASDDYFESDEFLYDTQGRFIRVYHEDLSPNCYYDTIVYDNKSQIEVDYAYQDRNFDGTFTLMSKCCYGYDDQGNVVWRDNYNSFGSDELSQSAHITYEYDAQGHLIQQKQYWAGDDNAFAVIDYEYNDAGLLIRHTESYSDFFDPGAFEEASKTELLYDANGNLIQEKSYNMNEGQYEVNNIMEYDYDERGCLVEDRLFAGGHVDSKNVYHYDTTVEGKDVLYPASHEYNIGITRGLNAKLTAQDVYVNADDDDSDEAVYAYTKNFTYEPCTANSVASLAANMDCVDARAKLIRLGSDGVCSVNVYGQDGKLALSLNARGMADLSTLPAGIYIASVKRAGAAPSCHKFVIK